MVILNASDPNTAKKINDIIKNSKHVFILVYMVGCGPCNATRPEWKKMCQSLNDEYSSNNQVAILDLDSKFMNEVKGLGDVNGFPTMKYINSDDNIIESYEDSNIPNKERISDSFVDWIKSKISKQSSLNSKSPMNVNELSEIISSKQPNSAKTIRSDSMKTMKRNTVSKKNKKILKSKKSKSKKVKSKSKSKSKSKNKNKK